MDWWFEVELWEFVKKKKKKKFAKTSWVINEVIIVLSGKNISDKYYYFKHSFFIFNLFE